MDSAALQLWWSPHPPALHVRMHAHSIPACRLPHATRVNSTRCPPPPPLPQVRREHEELRKRRLDEFMSAFNTISLKLKEMYQMITMGGDAELELVDSLDPFSGGWGMGGGGEESNWLLCTASPPALPPSCRSPLLPCCCIAVRPPTCGCCRGHPVQRATAQEELEEHCQPVRRREDALLAVARLCAAPLQAHAALRDGRDRRGAGCAERGGEGGPGAGGGSSSAAAACLLFYVWQLPCGAC